jgi:hypothetical protein
MRACSPSVYFMANILSFYFSRVQSSRLLRMVLDPRAVQIRVDGSWYGNLGGQSGCAAIVHYPEHLGLPDELVVDYGCSQSTNQRMELMPCIKALQWVREHQPPMEVLEQRTQLFAARFAPRSTKKRAQS